MQKYSKKKRDRKRFFRTKCQLCESALHNNFTTLLWEYTTQSSLAQNKKWREKDNE